MVINKQLTQQQKEAIRHNEGPALVLAVPGAGKTTVLITRAAYLIQEYGIDPRKILSLTFSKAAARDMKKRFQDQFGELINPQPHFSTIHSFAYQVLKRELHSKGIKYDFIEGKNAPINKMVMLKQLYYKFNKNVVKEEALEELSNAISFVKNRMLNRKEMQQYDFDIKNFEEIYFQYEDWKKKNKYIDFDDMLTLAYEILNKDKELCDRYRKVYSYIQVDEGQDTSPIQFALIRLISSPQKNIFIVADDDQSIYGFRGADPKELIEFKKAYPGGKVFYMEENFRSRDSIVSIAGKFIKGNQNRYDKNLYTQKQGGKPIIIKKAQNYYEQLDYLIEDVKSKENKNTIAILFRNHLSIAPLIDSLFRENIPFNLREGKRYFFHHWITKDITNFINLSLDHSDIKSFEGVFYKMNQYISRKIMDIVKKTNRNRSVFDALQNIEGLQSFQRTRMYELEEKFFTLSTLTPIKALEYIQDALEYGVYLNERSKTSPSMVATGDFVLARLKSIANNTSTLIEFLYRLEELEKWLENCSQNKETTFNITLSTLHGVKGLEFDRVYMIDLVQSQIPNFISVKQSKQGNIQLLEEERRLFYVGMTRAKEELTLLTISPVNNRQEYSQFIDEVQGCYKDVYNKKEQYLKPEDEVIHKKFGKGKILWLKGKTIAIDFENRGIKKLAADFCVQSGLLEKI
jgi:DNA helicase-2/ATP-dependent DNA helicase PcrA